MRRREIKKGVMRRRVIGSNDEESDREEIE